MADRFVHPMTRFHPNHGTNISLHDNRTVAYRKSSFADAITFTEKPIEPGEIFLIEIERTEPGWTGHMRLGLTQLNPRDASLAELPSYSLPDLIHIGNTWIWAIKKKNKSAFEADMYPEEIESALEPDCTHCMLHSKTTPNYLLKRYCRNNEDVIDITNYPRESLISRPDLLPTDEHSRVGVVYIPKGNLAEIHFIVNGIDQGIFTSKLPYREAPLFGVVDVYGTTKQVKIVQLYQKVPSLKETCKITILRCIATHGVCALPLPNKLIDYLLYEY